MAGLSPKHHGLLNNTTDPTVYDLLRAFYATDPVALQQIDVYDPGATLYHDRLRAYVQAIKVNDLLSQQALEEWFNTFYPDV